MWDGLLTLLVLCTIMAGASYLAGTIPLNLNLSARRMRLITAFGTGVLVGTALIVIIPEGIETIYTANVATQLHVTRSLARPGLETIANRAVSWTKGSELRITREGTVQIREEAFRTGPDDGFHGASDAAAKVAGASTDAGPEAAEDTPKDSPSGSGEHTNAHGPSGWVGLSLTSGFILMYLIDTLSRHASNSTQPRRISMSLARINLYSSETANDQPTTPTSDHFSTLRRNQQSSQPSSTTIGLVIHGLADGIALGASSATTSRLTFIIFIALMLHKAPAAFGLTTVLIKQGLSKRAARGHLLVFSLAAPIGALLTWSAAHLFGFTTSMGDHETAKTEFATGVLLLFSAGTFLYVAMHTMQDANAAHGYTSHEMNGNGEVDYEQDSYTEAPRRPNKEGSDSSDILATVIGMLVPLLTRFGHSH